MTRRAATATITLTVATTALCFWLAYRGDYHHVVLISIDTLRRDHVTTYGYDRPTTPNIDRLARRAVVFDQAIAANSNTAPAHASMFTGLYPPAHGVLRNRHRLRPAVPTLAGLLRDAGYRTGAFVSGFALTRAHTNLDRGFTHWDEKLAGKNERPADRTERAVTAWLWGEAHERPPNFVFVHFFDPHYPYAPPLEYGRRFARPGQGNRRPDLSELRATGAVAETLIDDAVRAYDGEIAFADAQLGKLLDALEVHGYWDEALVIFVADHGETLDDRGWRFDHGGRVNEEQIRIPFIIRFPGDAFAGTRIAGPVHQVDLLPTILDYLGIEAPAGLHGRSLMPVIRGEEILPPDRSLFVMARPEPARIVEEVESGLVARGMIAAVRAWPFKLIEYPGKHGPVVRLFDLRADPLEQRDVSADEEGRDLIEVVDRLSRELSAWRAMMGHHDSRPVPKLDRSAEQKPRSLGYTR